MVVVLRQPESGTELTTLEVRDLYLVWPHMQDNEAPLIILEVSSVLSLGSKHAVGGLRL